MHYANEEHFWSLPDVNESMTSTMMMSDSIIIYSMVGAVAFCVGSPVFTPDGGGTVTFLNFGKAQEHVLSVEFCSS